MKKLLLLAIVVLGISAVSFGQATATASSTATLVTPISIKNTVPMNFGKIGSSYDEDGNVVLGFTNNLTPSAKGVTVMADGAPTTAVFVVTGDAARKISVLYTTDPITLRSGEETLTVSEIIADCGASGAEPNLASGSLTIKIGAKLTIPKNTLAGTYENEDDLFVTVNYE